MKSIIDIQGTHGLHTLSVREIQCITSPIGDSTTYTVMLRGGGMIFVDESKQPRKTIIEKWKQFKWNED